MHNRTVATAAALACLVLGACERAEPSVIGHWAAAQEDVSWTIEMREDSTWAMEVGTLTGEGTFTATDDDQVQLHTTGRMAQVMPGGYRAEVQADTLRLCSVAGCSDFVRVVR
jgi:hypothetical protein